MNGPWITGPARRPRETHTTPEPSLAGTPADVDGVGEAMSGTVRVRWANGQVTSVEIDPSALRRPSSQLCEAIREATNAAVRDGQQRAQSSSMAWAAAAQEQIAAARDQYRSRLAETQQTARETLDALERLSEQHFGRHY